MTSSIEGQSGDSGSGQEDMHAIVIRPWPKIVFLYPTFLTAVIAGVWQIFISEHNMDSRETIGLVFYVVFCFNLLVISFEFTRIKTVAIFFLVLALIFLSLFLSTKFPVLHFFESCLTGMHLSMSDSYYFALAGFLFVVYLMVFVNTRWNYWEIRHNEIIHYTGFLGDIKRFPSPNLRMTKVINDVFEFLLLSSGRIVLYPASEREAIVLENVLNVNKAEDSIKRLLSTLAVKMQGPGAGYPVEH